MNRFAELLDRLAYEPGRNNKLRLLTNYFRTVEDPDRGYALAAITGALSFKHAKSGLIRDLITERTDPTLFGLSYDYVGDLSETVALMWPRRAFDVPVPSPLEGSEASEARSRGQGGGYQSAFACELPPSRMEGPHKRASLPSDLPLKGGGDRPRERLSCR